MLDAQQARKCNLNQYANARPICGFLLVVSGVYCAKLCQISDAMHTAIASHAPCHRVFPEYAGGQPVKWDGKFLSIEPEHDHIINEFIFCRKTSLL